jgi:hypothetical protein
MTDRPRTVDQFFALPEGPGFGREKRCINGFTVLVPVAPEMVAFWSEDEDVISCLDYDGIRWTLGRYADGSWFRHR